MSGTVTPPVVPPVTPPVVPPVVPPAAWHAGKVDATMVGHWQNKGWDVNDPVAVATSATKAHMEAEKFIGAPANEMLRMPKPEDSAGRAAFWQKLGAPATPEGYDFAGLKTADGKDLDPNFITAMRTTFANMNAPKALADEAAKAFVKYEGDRAAAAAAENAATLATARAELDKNWGANKAANLIVAQNAIRALGIKPEAVAALEGVAGYGAVMDMFRNIGTKIGEASFISNPSGQGGGSGVMTKDSAKARLDELKADSGWRTKLMQGDIATNREFQNLTTLMATE